MLHMYDMFSLAYNLIRNHYLLIAKCKQ
uniref:Uncharacterized protein n=1 Tax=Arundo donax TaxID=35708 RepID=A0A0A9H1W1_ARUDO